MPPIKCSTCMDAGFMMYDGTPRACGNCDAGREFADNGGQRLKSKPRAELNPMTLPPGGDVVITEMKRQAAGIPPGVIGGDILVRATIEVEPLVHELVRAVDDLTRDVPGADERAVQMLGGLPAWAIPDDVRDRDNEPVELLDHEDPEPLTLVGSSTSGKSSPVRRRRPPSSPAAHPAAPVDPPE